MWYGNTLVVAESLRSSHKKLLLELPDYPTFFLVFLGTHNS